MKTLKIPEATIIRLSVYSRFLDHLHKNGVMIVSSGEIARGVDGSPAQVRKDLAYFGEFGTRGVGYNVKDLNEQVKKILGLMHNWKVIIAGAGNLGSALIHFKGFKERGFNIQAIFDNDQNKVGQKIGDIPIYDILEMEQYVKTKEIAIAIVAIPARHAQKVVDILVKADIKAILNFAPCVISVPRHIELRSVDLTVNMEILTFNLALNKK